MAAPAVSSALDAVIARVEAIVPTIDAGQRFRRRNEAAPPTTKIGKRSFDVQFSGHLRDLSNEGAGVQTSGVADRIAQFLFVFDYAVARAEKALETTMAVDSELVLRALGRSANWAGTVVRRVVARSSVLRLPPDEEQPGMLSLVVTADVQYRDTE